MSASRPSTRSFLAALTIAVTIGTASRGGAATSGDCAAVKRRVVGRSVSSALNCYALAARKQKAVDPLCLARAEAKFLIAFARAERGEGCLTVGDADALHAESEALVAAMVAALPDSGPTPLPTASGTATLLPTMTGTPVPPMATSTATNSATPSATPAHTATVTPTASATGTDTAIPTDTPTKTATSTDTPSDTETPTETATVTPTATSTPVPCGDGAGVSVGPACWFLGNLSANCTNTCAAHGLVYDAETRSYAGSAGTDSHCLEVMTALSGTTAPGGSVSCAAGIGCHLTLFHLVERCSSPATAADAFIPAEQRACACTAPLPTPTASPSRTGSATPTNSQTPTVTDTPPPTATTRPTLIGKAVFVTSSALRADFGGLGPADNFCTVLGRSVGIAGPFAAWLSDDVRSADARLAHATVPYQLLDATLVANDWADLTDGMLAHAIDMTERGDTVRSADGAWTNTRADGSSAGSSCANWTKAASMFDGGVGSTVATDFQWTEGGVATCDHLLRLYCIEQ